MVKKSKALATTGGETLITGVSGTPDFSNILGNADLSVKDKRDRILRELGKKGTKKKYSNPEERKKAQKERAKKRREEKNKALAAYGLAPRQRGPQKSPEEKKAARKARRQNKKNFLHEMAKMNPEVAQKYGIDPSRFKFKT
jgi:flagellum-specific peptidoglycan hydrolase FlgJ